MGTQMFKRNWMMDSRLFTPENTVIPSAMAMGSKLLQYQASHVPATCFRYMVSSGGHPVCRLPSLLDVNQRTSGNCPQQLSRYSHLNFQSSHFFKTDSTSLLRCHAARHDTKPTHVIQASSRTGWEDDGRRDFKPKKSGGVVAFLAGLLKTGFRLASVVLVLTTVFAASAPAILSWPRGLKTVASLASHSIPGTVSVEHATLGWRKPVLVEGITLKGADGQTVVSIPKVETRASLWSIVSGKSGLGEAVVTEPVVDLQQDVATGQPRLALALTPLHKLQANNPNSNKKDKKPVPVEPPTDVALTGIVKTPRGGLEVVKGKIILPRDAATAIGPSVFVDVSAGRFAIEENELLASSVNEHRGKVPVRGNLYSDRAQAGGLGFLSLRRGQVELLQPLKAEMDLTPALGKLYLARVNPLLGEIIGPGIGDEDLPDVTLYVAPTNFVLPSDEYSFRIEPMKTTLAKGQIVDGLLSLLSKQDLSKGRSQVTAQTSVIEATINLKTGIVACSRLDLLIADRVHVATWGIVDIFHEKVQMTLAIPGSTLRDTLGLSRLAHDYYLKIPIQGMLDRLQVDWMTAGKGLAQLTLKQQKGGELFSSFFQKFEKEDTTEVPKPIEVLPWDNRSL